jgi:glutathione synthase
VRSSAQYVGSTKWKSFLHSINAYPPTMPPIIKPSSFPPNPSISHISEGLALAHHAYGPSKSSPQFPLCILFVVQTPENNVFDQFALSNRLVTHHGISTYRIALPSILSHTHISSSSSRALIYSPPHSRGTPYEVSLIYLRAGYTPDDYASPASWASRLQLERSAAIKCPSVLTHLAGCKKVQQILATPTSTHVARFLTPDSPSLGRIQETFTDIYPLNATPAGQLAIRLATDPETAVKYVLKPQREGGGNNIYGAKIPPFLKTLGDERNWRAHILMELIEPPALRNTMFRNGEVKGGEVVGELGVFGVCLWKSYRLDGHHPAKVKILENFEAGWLLRTKGRESEEGGVAAGFGAIDSVCLVDD